MIIVTLPLHRLHKDGKAYYRLCSLKLKRWESQPVMRLKLHCCVQSLYDEMVLIFFSSYKIELKTERMKFYLLHDLSGC